MTTTLSAPTIDIPIELVHTEHTCTAGHSWCKEEDNDPAGDLHCGDWAFLPVSRWSDGKWVEEFVTLHVRQDQAEDGNPVTLALLDAGQVGYTARQARIAAGHLLTAADAIDPLPVGAMATWAGQIRIGDDLLTDDGWQKVTGLLLDAPVEQAAVFTAERPIDTSDGWDLSFNDPVTVRRQVHGSCAIQFVEPIR